MALFILVNAAGIGTNDIDPADAEAAVILMANEGGIGVNPPVGNFEQVIYTRTLTGPVQLRLDALVNTNFTPNYGGGAQNVDTVVIPALATFALNDGTMFTCNGTALPPAGSGLPGAALNTTTNCLVIYDTQQTICVARAGTGGTIDLPISNPVVLYHEFSHAFRIVNNALLALTVACNPSSPEENAAIIDENDLRTQIANLMGTTPELRDPGIHCGDCSCGGGCCIVASLVSHSPVSPQVQTLRAVRDQFLRKTEVGFAFFDQLYYDYYGFSPQVCTMMGRQQELPNLLLEGYVHSLIDFWRLMALRSRGSLRDAQLGRLFAEYHADRRQAENRLAALDKTGAYWQDEEVPQGSVAEELVTLLRERAWPSAHVRWSLIEPVRMYRELLAAHLDGTPPEALGRLIGEAIAAWAPEIPLDHVWASLPAEQLQEELKTVESILLQSPENKTRFRRRLADLFGEITAVRKALDLPAVPCGDDQ